jgi:tetratricopeptide (TPR) repeat protein
MLFKKKKKETQATDDVSKVIEYSPEELQLINNLVEDFAKPPGHLDVPSEEGEEPVTDAPLEDEGAEPETTPSLAKPKIAAKPDTDLGEFDDLADMDLETIEEVEPDAAPVEDTGLADLGDQTQPEAETPPAADDFGLDDLGAETPPLETETTDDFGLDDLGAETQPQAETPPAADDDDFGLDDFGVETQPETETTDDFGLDDFGDETPPQAETPSTPENETTDDFGLDDLGAETPSTQATDDFGLDDFGVETQPEAETPPAADDFGLDDFGDQTQPQAETTDDFGFDDLGAETQPRAQTQPVADDFGLDDFDAKKATSAPVDDFSFDDMSPPSLDDVSPETLQSGGKKGYGGLADELNELADEQKDGEISDAQLNALRYTVKSFSPAVRQSVIETLLGNKLGKSDAGELIKKLVQGNAENEVKTFLEDKLGKKLGEARGKKEADRKVIVSRPQYTESGIESRKKLVNITKFAIVAVPIFLVVVGVTYFFGIKKYLYHRDINQGKELIMSQSFTGSDIPKAEKYFDKALERYPESSEAYLQFADAYRRQGLYENAFEKLFGKVSINPEKKAIRYEDREINHAQDIWSLLKKVPIIRYKDNDKKVLYVNDIPCNIQKKGAYILSHLDKNKDEAIVLYALGDFHSSPARKFSRSPYRNNRLGIDYYNRILNFKSTTPVFQREKFISAAILGIGNIYYNNEDFNRAHDYFEKIIRKDPYDVDAQTGMMKTLIKMYESPMYQTSNDPRLIIQQHSLIKHTYKIEKKLPMFILAKLASFYIDLPDKDDLRIEYNTSPTDKVNNKSLKSRAEELLNIMYNKTEEDMYGNKISGKTFAEGYYQRGRYFRNVVKEYRMAMTQFEYAFKYDPNHFMALNDRAEILMELNDYEGAKKHLLLAEEKITDAFLDNLGDRPEDETLLEADRGIVTFNLAKTMYLSRVKNLDSSYDWLRIQETGKFKNSGEYGKEALITMLDQVDMYLDKAEDEGLKSDLAKSELSYYRGWINYVKSDYAKALYHWQSISPQWDNKMPNLELAKSYALYYMGIKNTNDQRRYMETSLSHLYYLQGKYSPLAENVARPAEANKTHETIFSKMAIIENNMGAIFEVMGEEEKALMHYQKSIEYSKKINKENEIAHLNIRLSFKRSDLDVNEKFPLIMDFISPYLKDNVL